jgi:hypothetical protein
LKLITINDPTPVVVTLEDLRVTLNSSIPVGTDMVEYGYGLIAEESVPETPFGHARISQTYEMKEEPDDNGSVRVVHHFEVLPLADVANALRSKITAKRKQMEANGITLNGLPILTTIDDQNRITSVLLNAERAGITEIRFKSTMGFMTMTIPQLAGIANYIAFFVQGLFSSEGEHYGAIQTLEVAEDLQGLLSYDTEANWPNTAFVS